MNFYHLKYFYDSARLQSITRAATLNRVGQPAITKAIQNLEVSLETQLIIHERNRYQLSEQGELVYAQCEKIFSATHELRDQLKNKDPKITASGEVKFACPSSMAESSFLAEAVRSITTAYPLIQLKLMLGRTDLIRDWVRNGIADFGVIVDNIDTSEFEVTTIATGSFFLIKHPGYDRDWRKEGVMTVENKPEVHKLRDQYHSHYGDRLKAKLEIGSWGVIKRFVTEKIGVGFVPDYMIEQELKTKKLAVIEPRKLSVPYEIKIISVKDRYLNSRCKLVIDKICVSAAN